MYGAKAGLRALRAGIERGLGWTQGVDAGEWTGPGRTDRVGVGNAQRFLMIGSLAKTKLMALFVENVEKCLNY